MSDQPDKLERLEEIMDQIEAPVTKLYVNQRQHRKVIRALAVSLVFDIFLSLGLGALAFTTRSDVAQRAKAQCIAGNDFRRLDLERWNFILNLSGPPKTEQQKQTAAVFRSYIDQADAQRPC